MMPLLKKIRAAVKCEVAALPVPYRTTTEQPSFMSLTDPCCANARAFPIGLDPFVCTRAEIGAFASAALELGVKYLGVCCGAGPHHIRAMAEALGRHPAASEYSAVCRSMRFSARTADQSGADRLSRQVVSYPGSRPGVLAGGWQTPKANLAVGAGGG